MRISESPLEKCEACGAGTAWTGISVNGAMVVMKFLVGVTSGSSACIADGLHSLSNIITAFAILLSRKISVKERTYQYPYGYGKVEFVAAGGVSLLILMGSLLLLIFSLGDILGDTSPPPDPTAILAAVISIGANEMLFRYMRCAGTRLKSQTILANAWANRADSFSSMAVIIGVAGSNVGIQFLDPLCSLVVVAVIVKVSIDILIKSARSLMDISVNSIYEENIKARISDNHGVMEVAEIRTRQVGQKIWADIHLFVDPDHSVKEGRQIADQVRKNLLRHIQDLEHIAIYIEHA